MQILVTPSVYPEHSACTQPETKLLRMNGSNLLSVTIQASRRHRQILAQWVGHCPINLRVASSIPGRGTYTRQPIWCFSLTSMFLSLSFSLPLLLKIFLQKSWAGDEGSNKKSGRCNLAVEKSRRQPQKYWETLFFIETYTCFILRADICMSVKVRSSGLRRVITPLPISTTLPRFLLSFSGNIDNTTM